MKHSRRIRIAHTVVGLMELAGWLIFANNTHGPLFYGVMLLWISTLLRRDLPAR